MVRMVPLERVISRRTKGRKMREQVADEMHTLMRHRTPERRGWATLFELDQIVTDFVLCCVF